jgi:hypothetical protein
VTQVVHRVARLSDFWYTGPDSSEAAGIHQVGKFCPTLCVGSCHRFDAGSGWAVVVFYATPSHDPEKLWDVIIVGAFIKRSKGWHTLILLTVLQEHPYAEPWWMELTHRPGDREGIRADGKVPHRSAEEGARAWQHIGPQLRDLMAQYALTIVYDISQDGLVEMGSKCLVQAVTYSSYQD